MMLIRRNKEKEREHLHADSDDIPLVNLHEGDVGIMVHSAGGCIATRRLAEMGLTPGSEIKLLRKCSFHGPVEIQTRGVSLAIGYGLASKVHVRPKKTTAGE